MKASPSPDPHQMNRYFSNDNTLNALTSPTFWLDVSINMLAVPVLVFVFLLGALGFCSAMGSMLGGGCNTRSRDESDTNESAKVGEDSHQNNENVIIFTPIVYGDEDLKDPIILNVPIELVVPAGEVGSTSI